ncbi:unnamed protein product [Ectocarpus fasciculatus]
MALVDALAALEAQTTGVSEMPPLESSHVDRVKQVIEAGGGLPIERDCRKEILGVNEADLVEVILPLCTWLKGITQGPSEKGERVLVGLCGSAAAGKSTLAQLLCAAYGIIWGASSIQCISMDAYSYPNAHLAAEVTEYLGRACTLKDIKGLPKTLDCASLLRDLGRLRTPSKESIKLPAYSRDLHDPVPDCIAVAPDCRVVIVEGLHLLHQEGLWKEISAALHRTIFLDIPRSVCFDRVVGRKVANGRSRDSSESHFDRVDGPVWDQLQEEKKRADLVLVVQPIRDRQLCISNIVAKLTHGEPQPVPQEL